MRERSTTIHLDTILDAPAENVWGAMKHPASFLYVTRGLIGVPALTGRTEAFVEGEAGAGWLFLFHWIPIHRHAIELVEVNDDSMTLRSRERGGVLRRWDHTLHVEAVDAERSRYRDTVVIAAGAFTPLVARIATWLYTYRHRRWRKLARKHLSAVGPTYRVAPATGRSCER